MKHKFFFIYKNLIPTFLILFSLNTSNAQNPADRDTTIGLGTFNKVVHCVKIQPDNKILIAGEFTYYKTTPTNYITRLNSDGSVDNTFNIGVGPNSSTTLIALQPDGKIIIGGVFTTFNGNPKNRLVRLNADGSLDNTFNIGSGIGSQLTSSINAIAIQTDGKILIAGDFTTYNGITKNNLIRLNADGSIDNSFNIGYGPNDIVNSVTIQADGKILVGGRFGSFNGLIQKQIIRLNIDGSADNSFNIGTGFEIASNTYVSEIVIQLDGKILVGGGIYGFNGIFVRSLVRLEANGNLDNTFTMDQTVNSNDIISLAIQADGKIVAGTSVGGRILRLNSDGSRDNSLNIVFSYGNEDINTIAIQTDGKIVAGGNFTSLKTCTKNFLARINADGTLDIPFNLSLGLNNQIYNIALQPDGRILIGGSFNSFNGSTRNCLARLYPDGSLDNSFTIGSGFNNTVIAIALQPDGKILVGGDFDSFNGVSKKRILRLNPDGSLDNNFNIGSGGANSTVRCIKVQPDGKILVGGGFLSYNGVAKNRLMRLNTDGTLDNTFTIGPSPSSSISTITILPDGKMMVPLYSSIFSVVRLNANGSLDNTYISGTGANNTISNIINLEDGKLLISGPFTTFNGTSNPGLVRLNADGSFDNTFPNVSAYVGASSLLAIQEDKKIIVTGSGKRLVRLNPDGSLDNTFDFVYGTNNYGIIGPIALQPDGRILLGAGFTTINGILFNNIVRLNGSPVNHSSIQGKIYTDENKDCNFQTSEKSLANIIVKSLPGPNYGMSDSYGNYKIKIDSGVTNYTLSQEFNSIQSKIFINQCASSYNALVSGVPKDTCCFNFADSAGTCSVLNISVENTRMRRCFRSNTYVNYCNYGNSAASNAQIKVVYPSYVIPVKSTPMWSSKQDSVLIYDIGTIQKDFCGRISITDSVICGNESIRGLTQCIKAIISPSANCQPVNLGWDQSNATITGVCMNGMSIFTITNIGIGNMSDSLPYRVFVNDTIIYTGNYKLNSRQSISINYPSQGQTVRLEADQHPLYPGKSRPRLTIENCGTASSEVRGLIITAPQDDMEEQVSITCNTIMDSFDPNDKKSIPLGIGSTHQVSPGEEITYTIRFQNTGNDNAYTVTVIDTLDMAFDVASFTQGSSSHPYIVNISGKGKAVLTFVFNNINLPDSTIDKLGSMGLISFRITVPANTPIGTVIKNKSYIFFDYNSPVITNETMHTVNDKVEKNLSLGSLVKELYNPIANANVDQTVCEGNTVLLNGSIEHGTIGLWTTSGSGSFSPDAQTLNASYIPHINDALLGSVTLTLSPVVTGGFPATSDKMNITFLKESANAGSDQIICSVLTAPLSGSISGTTAAWTSSGTGSFFPDMNSLIATYTASAADTANGMVTLTLNSIGGACGSATDQNVIHYSKESANAGIDQTICAGTSAPSNGAASGSLIVWSSSGTGSFSPGTDFLNASYMGSPADIAIGMVTLTLTSSGGSCGSVSDQKIINYLKETANAGLDQSTCAGTSASVNGSISGTTAVWTSSGTGTFSDANTLNPNYTPSSSDISLGSVTLTLTSSGGLCNATTDQLILNVLTEFADAGSNQTICAGTYASLSGNISGTTPTWTSSGTGSFFASNSLGTTYNPSLNDIANNTVTLTLTSSGGLCGSATNEMELFFLPEESANAGPDQDICVGSPATLNGIISGTNATWTTSGTGIFSTDAHSLNVNYIASASDIAHGKAILTLTSSSGLCATASDTIEVTINTCTGINSTKLTDQIKIYPNPAGNYIEIEFPSDIKISLVSIYNILGEKLEEEKVSGPKIILNLEDRSTGIYYIQMRDESGRTYNKNFIKN
jgi:uncharacterized delta-60 repeat protein/uncharacterized repeat protein (TIGR01451 family)